MWRSQFGKIRSVLEMDGGDGLHNVNVLNATQLFFFFLLYCVACGILVPPSGIETRPLKWKPGVLTTGPLREVL